MAPNELLYEIIFHTFANHGVVERLLLEKLSEPINHIPIGSQEIEAPATSSMSVAENVEPQLVTRQQNMSVSIFGWAVEQVLYSFQFHVRK